MINKKNKSVITMKKHIKVKYGIITIQFPLSNRQFCALESLQGVIAKYCLDWCDEVADITEYAELSRRHIEDIFGKGSYNKIFGNGIASPLEIGTFFNDMSERIENWKRK